MRPPPDPDPTEPPVAPTTPGTGTGHAGEVWRAPQEPQPTGAGPAPQYHHPLTGAEPSWERVARSGGLRLEYPATGPLDATEEALGNGFVLALRFAFDISGVPGERFQGHWRVGAGIRELAGLASLETGLVGL